MERKSSTGLNIAFTYNNKGIIASRTRSEDPSDKPTVSVTYRHDENGNIISAEQRNYKYEGDQLLSVFLISSAFVYDDTGKLATTIVSQSGTVTETIRYEYDEYGNNTKRTSYESDGSVASTKSYSFAPSTKPIVNHNLSTLRFFP